MGVLTVVWGYHWGRGYLMEPTKKHIYIMEGDYGFTTVFQTSHGIYVFTNVSTTQVYTNLELGFSIKTTSFW